MPGVKVQKIGGVVTAVARRLGTAGLAYGHGTMNAREEAAWLVLHACGVPSGVLEQHSAVPVTPPQLRRIESLVERRIGARIPVAYLLREAWLGDFRFFVDQRVIVPRSFIAELLEDELGIFLRGPVRNALDLCTGSGCLAILMAHAYPKAKIDAVDLSSAALAVAKRNVAAYGLQKRIRLLRSDLYAAVEARKYDLIISNPPYVAAEAMSDLPEEYRAEPRMALTGGQDGLQFVRRILAGARRQLRPGGLLVCEIGHNRKALERSFPRAPFTWLETTGGNSLVFLLEKEQLPD